MQFLSERAAINQFISNFNRFNHISVTNYIKHKCILEEDFKSIFSGAFGWDNTPEGFEYWKKLSIDWRIYINDKIAHTKYTEETSKNNYNSIW